MPRKPEVIAIILEILKNNKQFAVGVMLFLVITLTVIFLFIYPITYTTKNNLDSIVTPSYDSPMYVDPETTINVISQLFIYKTSLVTVDVSYTGEWKYNKPNGAGQIVLLASGVNGIITWNVGDRYAGNFVNGLLEGGGDFYSADGTHTYANFSRGIFNGEGTIEYINGDIVKGRFVSGLLVSGTYIFANGDVYKGQFLSDKFHGRGTLRNSDGDIIHNGNWENGVFLEN
jgi:hypothetical protein